MPDGGTRTQYPFRLAFAMTIHKAQGQTLRRVVVDIGEKERVLGMFFVALSSVKHINDLAVESLSFDRLTNLDRSIMFKD
jgi:hypothetical protein